MRRRAQLSSGRSLRAETSINRIQSRQDCREMAITQRRRLLSLITEFKPITELGLIEDLKAFELIPPFCATHRSLS
jgi:hypothetical protein